MYGINHAEIIKKKKGFDQLNYLNDTVMTELIHPHQISDFIRDMVRKTTKESNWQVAYKAAETINDKAVWGTFTSELKQLVGKSNIPTWATQIISYYAKNVVVDNYDLKNVLTVFVRIDYIEVYFNNVSPRFDLVESYRAFRDILLQISPVMLSKIISHYNDWHLITELYYGKMSDIVEIKMLAKALKQVETQALKNFDSFDLEWLMKTHPEPFKNVDVINSAIAAHKVKRTHTATSMLVDIIMNGFSEDSQLSWLWGMYSQKGVDKNETINNALYQLTNDDKYLPQDVKDIFR